MTGPFRRLDGFARYAWLVLAYNVAVVLWGALVRATGSGAGCGRHWPRCNGVVVPRSPSAETLIEFTHRATSGVALLSVVVLLALAFRRRPAGHPARRGALWAMALMLVEAALGAGLVLLELVGANTSGARAMMTGLHLANTFLLLGALTLSAWWASGGRAIRFRGQGGAGVWMGTAAAATLAVGVTGAITALGDTLFPRDAVGLELSGTAHFLERLRIVHPVAAVATGVFLVLAARTIRRLRPDPTTARLTTVLSALVGTQIAAGALNVAMLAPVWMQLVHLLLADALWITLVLTAASALAVPATDADEGTIGGRRSMEQTTVESRGGIRPCG